MKIPVAETVVLGEDEGHPIHMVYQDSHTPAPAPVLLLLHGLFDQRGTWNLVWPLLADRFRLIAPDLVGFGASSKPRLRSHAPAQRYSLAMHAGHVVRLIEHLGLARVVLGGNSLGGGLALYLWCTCPPLRPAIAGLALLDPACYPQPLPGYVRQVAGCLGVFGPRPRGLAHRLASSLAGGCTLPLFADPADPQRRTRSLRREPGVSYAYRRGPEPAPPDWRLRCYREVSCPVLVIWGEEDQVVPAAFAARLQADIPRAVVRLVPGCGHAPQLERPDLVAAALASWVPQGV